MDSKRPLVSYDDITPSYQSTRPPPKKRKWNKQKTRPRDEPRPIATSSSNPDNENIKDETESRELTFGEIWDDSALIDAWNAATEEYEAYNGPDKGWKNEPIHKSPLYILPYYRIQALNIFSDGTINHPQHRRTIYPRLKCLVL